MIVEIGTTALCAGTRAGEHIIAFSGSAGRLVQESRPIGSAAGKAINRDNVMTTREFQVVKDHASELVAEQYLNIHEAACFAASGDITFTAEAPLEINDVAYKLGDATLESVEIVDWIGRSTTWRYRIRGGALTLVT